MKQVNRDVIPALLSALKNSDARAAAADILKKLAKSLQEQISKSLGKLEALLAEFEQHYLPTPEKIAEIKDETHMLNKIHNEDIAPAIAHPTPSLSAILAQPNGPGFFAPDVVSTQQQNTVAAKTEEKQHAFVLN